MAILDISGLKVKFMNQSGIISALDSVDFLMEKGDSCAIVGESGCGKSVFGMSVMRLLPSNSVVEGSIRFKETNLTELSDRDIQKLRGREIALIPQNSAMALNPVMTVGRQLTETLMYHHDISRKSADISAKKILLSLGINDPDHAMICFPHEFSGGMRERILIGTSLMCNPALLIADEPTAGLDLLVRNQTINLLKEHSSGKSLLLITHDLGCAYNLCLRMVVMYAGEIVESGPTKELLKSPRHPYTIGLLACIPSAGLHPIPGMSPSPRNFPKGCRFYSRCSSAMERCLSEHPSLIPVNGSRYVRCLYYD